MKCFSNSIQLLTTVSAASTWTTLNSSSPVPGVSEQPGTSGVDRLSPWETSCSIRGGFPWLFSKSTHRVAYNIHPPWTEIHPPQLRGQKTLQGVQGLVPFRDPEGHPSHVFSPPCVLSMWTSLQILFRVPWPASCSQRVLPHPVWSEDTSLQTRAHHNPW